MTPRAASPPPDRARRRRARAVVAAALLIGAGYLGTSAVAAVQLSRPQRRWAPARTPADAGAPHRDVRLFAQGGGVEIAGWFLPHRGARRAIVMVHGKDSSRAAEFHGGFVVLAAALHARGFAVLMVDLRGHGQSGEARFSFGLHEQRDVAGAADWLQREGIAAGRVGVLGVSMGAAAAILATAATPGVGALVADSGYAAIRPVLEREWRGASGLPDLFLPSTLWMGRLLFGYDASSVRPVDAMGRIAPRPALIIHGTEDRLVPIEHARRLLAALPSAELWEVEGAGHAGSYERDPRGYTDRVAAFFERSLEP